jgi:hypothetical protein
VAAARPPTSRARVRRVALPTASPRGPAASIPAAGGRCASCRRRPAGRRHMGRPPAGAAVGGTSTPASLQYRGAGLSTRRRAASLLRPGAHRGHRLDRLTVSPVDRPSPSCRQMPHRNPRVPATESREGARRLGERPRHSSPGRSTRGLPDRRRAVPSRSEPYERLRNRISIGAGCSSGCDDASGCATRGRDRSTSDQRQGRRLDPDGPVRVPVHAGLPLGRRTTPCPLPVHLAITTSSAPPGHRQTDPAPATHRVASRVTVTNVVRDYNHRRSTSFASCGTSHFARTARRCRSGR